MNQNELKEILHYDPETGYFTWLVDRRKGYKDAGQRAGHLYENGYRVIGINRRNYPEHRLAWLYMTGAFPKEETDHINMVRNDNRFCNLREATRAQNQANSNGWNKSGMKGARQNSNGSTWWAHITVNKKTTYLGSFKTQEEAHLAYCAAAQRHHGEYWRK